MTDAPFSVDITGIEQVQKQLASIPPAVIPAVQLAVGNYLLNALIKQEIPPQKRVKRRDVYGKPFQSNKQRRWFFWALKHGIIDVPYRRRGRHGGISTRWHIIQIGKGIAYKLNLQNDDPAAKYVYGDDTQNKLIGVIGWKKIGAIVDERSKKLGGVMKRAADTAIKQALRKT